jgi:hypothetical protein
MKINPYDLKDLNSSLNDSVNTYQDKALYLNNNSDDVVINLKPKKLKKK